MNIKTRIEKLESRTNPTGDFCRCYNDHFNAMLTHVYDNVPLVEVPLPEGNYCGKCRKPVNPMDSQTLKGIIEVYGE